MQPLEHEHLYNINGTGYSCINEQIYCGKKNVFQKLENIYDSILMF